MDKSLLRKKYLHQRTALSPEQREFTNQQIWGHLKNLLDWDHITALHLYLPIIRHREVDTRPVIDHVRQHHPKIDLVVPKITADGEMEHYVLLADDPLSTNQWGIPEPAGHTPYDINRLQIVLVPLIIFDKNGHRVGYGKGYYDRFLGKLPPAVHKIGLSVFPPVETIPSEPTDITLDTVVTPKEVYHFQKP